MKRILAIDPSSSAAGFAFFIGATPQWCKTIKPKGATLLDRMTNLLYEAGGLIDENKPDYIAIELPYLGFSKSTSLKMGQIFGMICALCVLKSYTSQTILEVHAMSAKKAVGAGNVTSRETSKIAVFDSVKKLFPFLEIEDDNASDALAIGVAALGMLPLQME
jgi:Holliday junction resolvasome RuvABC endonuclease subunit